MRTSQGTAALLALEDSAPDILFRTVPNTAVPIWPHVRMSVAQAMAAAELGTESVSNPNSVSRSNLIKRYAAAYLPAVRRPRRVISNGICFFVGGTTVRPTNEGLENWLVDDLARTAPGTTVFQTRPLQGRPAFADTFSLDSDFARLDVANRIRPTAEPPVDAVRSVLAESAALLDMSIGKNVLESIVQSASYSLSRIDRIDGVFARLLDRLQPDVVVMEDASYGSYAHVIGMMKARGIHVVEPQHGWIGPSHAAYNFGAAMRTPELFATVPDALLTFGEFWSSSVRYPGDVVAIGKPHMNAMSDDLPPFHTRPRTVMIASSVSAPDEMSTLVLDVRDALPEDWSVVFRAHPSERSTHRSRYPRLVDAPRVEFDANTDVYESMKATRAVIGVASTVLYEALAMGCHVFVRDSPYAQYYMDDVLGETLSEKDDLMRMSEVLTAGVEPSVDQETRDRFWKSNAAENFETYIRQWRTQRSRDV